MGKTRLVCVGACAIDTILTVPHFPEEDSKLRATSFTKRRGGNTPNTLEVLQQLFDDNLPGEVEPPEIFLVATLPALDSADSATIASSFEPSSGAEPAAAAGKSTQPLNGRRNGRVDLSHCIYRPDFAEAVSSYIISSDSTSSRTIINRNALPEMTFDEFVATISTILTPKNIEGGPTVDQIWFHFEGRIPATTLECVRYLRRHPTFRNDQHSPSSACSLKVSVEVEKPGRDGLQELAQEADVVFYSKAWAKGLGYDSAEACLKKQAEILSLSREPAQASPELLVCTWGDQGASALLLNRTISSPPRGKGETSTSDEILHSPAYVVEGRPIVDSTGAGDTFNAGMLYGLVCRAANDETPKRSGWTLRQTMDFANGLAGRKILQQGFQGLGRAGLALMDVLGTE